MLNRAEAPPIKMPSQLTFPEVEKNKLDNGIDVLTLHAGVQDVVIIEFVFKAGRKFEDKRQVAHFTNALLDEGTKLKTGRQLSDELEFYGASLKTITGYDYSSIIVSCLSKFFQPVLKVMQQLVLGAAFPEREIIKFKKNQIERLKVNLSKHEYIASKKSVANLWGYNHPYGYPTTINDYNDINQEDLLGHYTKSYHPQNCKIYIAGKPPLNYNQVVNDFFGTWQQNILTPTKSNVSKVNYDFPSIKNANQVSVRMVYNCIDRRDDDYPFFYFVNTILGGYFGSRLMTNIREDKGYTYGIYAVLYSMLGGGQGLISAEVGKQYVDDTLNEISNEINRLKTELITKQELLMVKNYLMGYCLTLVDGTFNRHATLKEIDLMGLSTDYFNNFVNKIKTINAEQLMLMAQKHLPEAENMIVVCEG